MTTQGHIKIYNQPIPIIVSENANFRTIRLGSKLGEYLPEEQKYFEDYPVQLERLLRGEIITM